MMDCGATDIGKGKKDTTKSHCPHGKKKSFCEICGGNSLCEHKKQKCFCVLCNGGGLRKTPHCPTVKKSDI